jgi:hypothetical protein
MSVFFLILGKSPSVGITAAFYINSFIKEYCMKNSIKLFGIIASVAIIIFSMTGCPTDDGGDDGAGPGPGTTPQTPIAADYDIGNLSRITGSNPLSGVSVTAKTGKSTGAVTVYYEGISPTVYAKSDTVPQAVGKYAVTFDVAAAAGWNAANGLSAGTLTITDPTLTGITAAYSAAVVEYKTDQPNDIDDLKADLTVTAQYSNGESEEVTDYELEGTLSLTGASDITVTYEGEIDTFTVTAYAFFAGASAMSTFLNNLDANTAETAYNIKLNVSYNPFTSSGQAQTAFNNKYVNLDLSGATLSVGIGERMFYNCTLLTSITIPASITSTPNGQNNSYGAFNGCTNLTSVTFAEGSQLTTIGNYTFYNCPGLTGITIPEGVTSIGVAAFNGCTGLTGITIPEGVTIIGESAFYDCTGLANITIPASVTSISTSAFYQCTGLTSVTIPEGVTSIGDYAFRLCSSLTSITIPAGVTSIGQYAFQNCTALASVTIPASVTTIGENAFFGCTGLTSVTISEGVTTIGASAFFGCSSLTSITIPASVTSIGNSAFSGCTSLASVTISEGVTSISNSAFYQCRGLTSVTIPASVTSIGQYAFADCTGITSVTIPASVTSIGAQAFNGCPSLASVTFEGTIDSGSFNTSSPFPGDLRAKYFAEDGGPGTYIRTSGTGYSTVWTKQPSE